MGWESDLWGRKVPQSPGNDALRCFNDGLFGQWGGPGEAMKSELSMWRVVGLKGHDTG